MRPKNTRWSDPALVSGIGSSRADVPLHATAAHLGAHFDLAAGRGGHGADCYVVNPLAELLATYPELMGLQRGA